MDLQRGTARPAGEFCLRKPDITEKIYTHRRSFNPYGGGGCKNMRAERSTGIQEDPGGRKEVGEDGVVQIGGPPSRT